MQIVPGQLIVFGTSGDYVIFDQGGTKPHVLRSEIDGLGDVKPGDVVPGYIWKDGKYHVDPQG